MALAFYRKYRPARFADVLGQDTAVTTLTRAILHDRIGHAYLFTGPRGTGKTTLARLFARAVNCTERESGAEPCDTCLPCRLQLEGRSLDIMEIDAASHTGVDHIRELKETVALPPTVGRYKVYIIDEAHMLSLGAWNALLKTLEEPPSHVIFILATTAVEKVPETILSRTMRFDLGRLPIEIIVTKLKKIARSEKITITPDALTLIARSAQGGMRDAEALFAQIATLEASPIEVERVSLLLGSTSPAQCEAIYHAMAQHDLLAALSTLSAAEHHAANMTHFASELIEYGRALLLASVDTETATQRLTDFTTEERQALLTTAQALGSERIVAALEAFQEAASRIKYSPLPVLPLEIACAKIIGAGRSTRSSSSPESLASPSPTSPPVSPVKSKPLKSPTQPVASPKVSAQKTAPGTEASPAAGETLPTPPLSLEFVRERWPNVAAEVKRQNASLAVAVGTRTPLTLQGDTLMLHVKYPFHKERLEEAHNRLTLSQAFATILGFPVTWGVELETKSEVLEEPSPLVERALEMLGGKLVQES